MALSPVLATRNLRKSDSSTMLEPGSPKMAQRILTKINEKRKSIKINISFARKDDGQTSDTPAIPPLSTQTDEELIDHMANAGTRGFMGRTRSVSEVGSRVGPESLYRLETDEIWDVLESNWSEWGKNKAELVYIICRKGVPKHKVGEIWVRLSKLIPNTRYIMCAKEAVPSPTHFCLYHQLCELSSSYEQQILADIHRTFPDQACVTEQFQKSLFNILKAYSLYDEKVGYCQGLSFVGALLLMQAPEEQVFYILARLMKGHDLRSIYTEDMRGVQLRMFQMSKLVQQLFPGMWKHLESLDVKISLVLIPWFMTAFTYQLPVVVAFRVMDALLLEGIPALFRIALSILLMCETDVMGLDEQGIMEYFRSDLRSKFTDPQQLMNIAYAVNVSVPQLEQMELEFIQNEKDFPPSLPSPFVDHTVSKEKIHVNQILVENHELREKNRQQAEELQALQLASEQYRKRAESEKIGLLRRLALVNESLELALVEKKDVKERMGRAEKDIDNMQVNVRELMNANISLSEELRLALTLSSCSLSAQSPTLSPSHSLSSSPLSVQSPSLSRNNSRPTTPTDFNSTSRSAPTSPMLGSSPFRSFKK